MQYAHRAQLTILNAAQQFLTGFAAVNRHDVYTLFERHTHDTVTLTYAIAFMLVGNALSVPGCCLTRVVVQKALRGTRIVGIVPLQKRVEQLRVATVTVVTLAVVL